MLSSIGQQPSNQMLRLVDRDRLVAQRVRVIPNEKLISIKAVELTEGQNVLDNLCDLSTDFVLSQNSNNDELLDLGNTQMSGFLREFSNSDKDQMKEEEKNTPSNLKLIGKFAFYYCDSCPFLCLDIKWFLEHKEKDHHIHHAPLKSLLRTKCIGCDNIFYSVNVLRCHLIEDHDVLPFEVDGLIQIVVESNKEDTLYTNDEISQSKNINPTDFDNVNEIEPSISEFGQKSLFIDTQALITEQADNSYLNETCENYWDYQEEVFNGLQENNSDYDKNTIPKHLRCTYRNCKLRFRTEDNLKYHSKCHSKEEFQCIEYPCQFSNTKWLSMMSHLWKVHKIDLEMFSCNQCEFKTNSLYKLNTFHKTLHKKEKPFLCPECSKGFKSIKQLRNHKVIHSKKESPFKNFLTCEHCCRDFANKRLLQRHITSIHIGARPYLCTVCDYTTAFASSLKLHMRSHTGEKPFVCEECNFCTGDHNTLRKHKMRHTGQKNYKCTLCTYSCIQASSFKKHLKNKHPGMDEGIIYSCNLCNFKTLRKDLYLLHIVKHKEKTMHKNGIYIPIAGSDEVLNDKEETQAENIENSYPIIRVKSLNSLKHDEVIKPS